MVVTRERAMFRLRLKATVFIAVLLTLCASLSSSQINTCSQDLSNVLCRARCAAAASTNSISFSDCFRHCCGNRRQSTMLPEDCPLPGMNCSQTPNSVNVSSVSWKRNGLEFHYSTSALEVGRDACNMVQDGTIPDGLLPLVVSADAKNGSSHFWILFPGQSNNLLLPADLGSCSNLSMAVVNECGMQELSATDVVPPNVNLKVVSLTAIEGENSLPVVTVAWQLEEVEHITDIIYNVTLVESNFLPKNGCVTASKSLSQTDLMASSITFYPEDFQGNSVWLCFYDATVSVSYKTKCGRSNGHEINGLKEKQVLITGLVPRLNTSFSFYWNSSTLSYVIHINWTLPLIYDIPKVVQTFQLTGSTMLRGRLIPSFRNFALSIPATGDTSYHITIEDYPSSQDDEYFFLIPGYGFISHPPPRTAELVGPLKLRGEPPSVVVVTSITEVMQGGVQVMWMAPNVTNGVILSYTVEVRLLTEGGHTVYASNYTVTEGLSFVYNFSGVDRMVDRVLMRVAAQNTFAMGPFSEDAYLGEPPSVVAVTSITEVMQGGVRVMWMAPNVTNGVILSYTVEVKLLTEGGHTVYAHNYTVTEGLSFIYNFSGVNRTMVDRIQLRVAAQNNFTMGPFSEHAYLKNDRNEVTEMALAGTLGTSGDVLAALVAVPVVVTVADILVMLLIFGVLLYKRRNKPSRPVSDVLLKERCYHAATCY